MSAPDPSIHVRHLESRDAPGWRVLWAAYTDFYRVDIPDEVSTLTFKRLCEGADGVVGLVAVTAADEAIGLAHLVFHASTWSATDDCYLEDLYVDPAHRGGRVARTLIDAVFAAAAQRGVARVYWHTQQFNGAARSLYDTVGALTSFVVYEHLTG